MADYNNYKVITADGRTVEVDRNEFDGDVAGFVEDNPGAKIRMKMTDGSTRDVALGQYNSMRQQGASAWTYGTKTVKKSQVQPQRQVMSKSGQKASQPAAPTGGWNPWGNRDTMGESAYRRAQQKAMAQQKGEKVANPDNFDYIGAMQPQKGMTPMMQQTLNSVEQQRASLRTRTEDFMNRIAGEDRAYTGAYKQQREVENDTETFGEFVGNNPRMTQQQYEQLPLRTNEMTQREQRREDLKMFKPIEDVFDAQLKAQREAVGASYAEADQSWGSILARAASNGRAALGTSIMNLRAANREYDPEMFAMRAAFDELDKRTQGRSDAERAALGRELLARMQDRLVGEKVFDGAFANIVLGGLKDNFLVKTAIESAQTDYQNTIDQLAQMKQSEMQGFWEGVAKGTITFASEMPLYAVTGGATGAAGKALATNGRRVFVDKVTKDLMARGMEKGLARVTASRLADMAARGAGSKASRLLSQAMKASAHGAGTFGGADAIKGAAAVSVAPTTNSKCVSKDNPTGNVATWAAQQMADGKEVTQEQIDRLTAEGNAGGKRISEIAMGAWGEGWRGTIMGAMMGGKVVPQQLIGRGGGATRKFIGDALGFQTEVMGMTMGELSAAALSGEAGDFDFWQTLLQTEANLATFKVPGIARSLSQKRVKGADGRYLMEGGKYVYEFNGNVAENLKDYWVTSARERGAAERYDDAMRFTPTEIEHYKQHQPDFLNAVVGLMKSTQEKNTAADDKAGKTIEQKLASFLADENLTEQEKQKMLYRMTGITMRLSPMTAVEVDGTTMRLLNKDGKVISETKYDTDYEAEFAALDHKQTIDANNRQSNLEAAKVVEVNNNWENWLEADVKEIGNKKPNELTEMDKLLQRVSANKDALNEALKKEPEERSEDENTIVEEAKTAAWLLSEKHSTVEANAKEMVAQRFGYTAEQLTAAIEGHTNQEATKQAGNEDAEAKRDPKNQGIPVGVINIGRGKYRTTKEHAAVMAYDAELKARGDREASMVTGEPTTEAPVKSARESVKEAVTEAVANGTDKVEALHDTNLETTQAAEVLKQNGISATDDAELQRIANDEAYPEDVRTACQKVLDGREAMKGADDAMNEQIERQAQQFEQQLNLLQHTDEETGEGSGTTISATWVVNGEEQGTVYVKKGDIYARDEDGRIMVDEFGKPLLSSNMLEVVDMNGNPTGHVENGVGMLRPSDLKRDSILDTPIADRVADYKARLKAQAEQQIAAMNQGGQIDPSADRFVNEEGKEKTFKGVAEDGSGFIMSVDGKDVTLSNDQMIEARDRARAQEKEAEAEAKAKKAALETEAEKKRAEKNAAVNGDDAATNADNAATNRSAQAEVGNEDAIPTDETGEAVLTADGVEPKKAVDYLRKEVGFSDEDATGFVDEMLEKANKALEKAQKSLARKKNEMPAAYLKRKAEVEKNVKAAQREVERWNAIKSELQEQLIGEHPENFDLVETDYEDVLNATLEGMPEAIIAQHMPKITPESFKAETGLGGNEINKMPGQIASKENGGMDIATAAEKVMEFLPEDSGLTDADARNIIIDIMREGGAKTYLKNLKQSILEQMKKDEQRAREEQIHRAQEEGAEGTAAPVSTAQDMPFEAGNADDAAPFSLTSNIDEHNRRVEKRGGLRRGEAEGTLEEGVQHLLDSFGQDTGAVVHAVAAITLWDRMSERDKAKFEGGFESFRKEVNGSMLNGHIYVNTESEVLPIWTLGHELTHYIKGDRNDAIKSDLWNSLTEYVRMSMGEEAWKREFNSVKDTYDGLIEGKTEAEINDYVTEEVVANWAGDVIFRDTESAKQMLDKIEQDGGDSLSIAQKMLNLIRNLYNSLMKVAKPEDKRLIALKAAKETWETLAKMKAAEHREAMAEAESMGTGVKMSIVRDPELKKRLERELSDDAKFVPIDDIRKMLREGKDLKELGEGYTLMYRAARIIDGKVYSPKMTKLAGKGNEVMMGEIEQSDERPDLAFPVTRKDGTTVWKVNLDGGDPTGSGLKDRSTDGVNYNPYLHLSSTMMNDQFTAAFDMPEMGVIEVRVPLSELTSAYKAEKAAGQTGISPWHSGTVNGSLKPENKRSVALSRYDMPVRIVPTQEVVDHIAKILKENDVEMPYNLVTPQVAVGLVKAGAKVSDKHSGSVPKGQDEAWLKMRQEAEAEMRQEPRFAISKEAMSMTGITKVMTEDELKDEARKDFERTQVVTDRYGNKVTTWTYKDILKRAGLDERMQPDEAFEKEYYPRMKKMYDNQMQAAKLYDYLKATGTERTRSNQSESEYFYKDGFKFRFSGHRYPAGSMTELRYDDDGNVTGGTIDMTDSYAFEKVQKYTSLLDDMSQQPISAAGEKFSKKKNTDIGNRFTNPNGKQGTLHATSISSVSGAKVLNDFEIAKETFKKIDKKGRHTKGFLPYISSLIGKEQSQTDGSRKYRTFKLDNGTILTIRLGGHNTSVHTYDDNGEANALSIVISAKPNRGIKNDGKAHVIEYFYDNKSLMNADGQPQYEIINSIYETLKGGEYVDRTGVAKRQEVNYSNPEYRKMLDDIYMASIEEGAEEKLHDMVADAARGMMPETKVVDEKGEPKVVYHGRQTEGWNTFTNDQRGSNVRGSNGFYFSPSKEAAAKWGDGDIEPLSVYLDIKNPYYAKSYGEVANMSKEKMDSLIAQGYDGMIYDAESFGNSSDLTEYVAFKPEQIKSADAVTYDDAGKVIPLSERFNEGKKDIRFSIADKRREAAETDDLLEKARLLKEANNLEAQENKRMDDLDGVKLNKDREVVAMNEGENDARFSLSTFERGGEEAFHAFLGEQKEKGLLTDEDVKYMKEVMQDQYETAKALYESGDYESFNEWSDSPVVTTKEGDVIYTVIKPNAEYGMNLDFSLICKKRRTLDKVLNQMIDRGLIESMTAGNDDVSIAKINDIIRKHGFETACRLCFVDAKRFRQAKVADDFVQLYNALVNKMVPKGSKIKPSYFDFAGYGRMASEMPLHEAAEADVQGGVDALRKIIADENKRKGDKPGRSVRYKIATHLLEHPEDRRLLQRGDFMSSQGFDGVNIDNPAILGLYNSKKGSGGPKAAESDVQYLNDVAKAGWDPEKAYKVGGVRVQSFSDYVPHLVFDYMQMFAELAAGKLPAHAYTKEELFAKLFGKTGIKINLSLVPAVVEGGIAPGLDAEGNYAWQEGETFPYDIAVELQNTDGYRENVGTIAVGISDAHIRKLLADPNIRMVIPYHKSGINKKIAIHNGIDKFVDYTKEQNTRYKATGKKLSKSDHEKEKTFSEYLKEQKDPAKAAEAYVRDCENEKNGWLPKFDRFLDKDADGKYVMTEGYYKLLEDFTTYVPNEKGGFDYYPQREVRMDYPKAGDKFGSMSDLMKRGLEEDADLARRQSEEVSPIVDEIQEALGLEPMKGEAKFSVSKEKEQQLLKDYTEAEHTLQYTQPTYDKYIRAEKQHRESMASVFDDLINQAFDDAEREKYVALKEEQLNAPYTTEEEYNKRMADAREFVEKNRADVEAIRTRISEEQNRLADAARAEAIRKEQERKSSKPVYAEFTDEQKAENEQKFKEAKKEFGTTTDLNEAGYILPNGQMLDFSGRKEAGASAAAYLAGGRTMDHRSISRVEDGEDGWSSLMNFVHRGAIRVVPESGDINLGQKPTAKQMTQLKAFVRKHGGDVGVEFYDDNKHSEHYVEYSKASAQRVAADISRYFDEGIRPQSNARFSVSVKERDPFYSNAAKAVEDIKQEKATAEQWLKMIEKAGGLKKGEDKWMGLSEWLKQQNALAMLGDRSKTLTKQEVMDFISKNAIKIEEVKYGDDEMLSADEIKTKYPEIADVFYVDGLGRDGLLPIQTGKTAKAIDLYNEETGSDIDAYDFTSEEATEVRQWATDFVLEKGKPINDTRLDYTTEGLANKKEIALVVPTIEPYNESDNIHFGDAGAGRAVAWVRFGEAMQSGTDGTKHKVLVIDEIQSKRHQDGRELGYAGNSLTPEEYNAERSRLRQIEISADTEAEREEAHRQRMDLESRYISSDQFGIPDAPFDKNWHELAMKRMLRYAAENGYDKVAWTTGRQQAERYNLRNVLDEVTKDSYDTDEEHTMFVLDFKNETQETLIVDNATGKITKGIGEGNSLSDLVGKSVAEKMMELPEDRPSNVGDMEIGGEGMKGFYDQMLPKFMQKYGKKWGAKVGEVELDLPNKADRKMWSVDVTPEMKESVMQGQPMFSLSKKETDKAKESAKKYGYGAPYTGSKNKVANDIMEVLPKGKRFVDLFAGGGAMSHAALLSGKYDGVHMNDKFPAGIQLFMDGIDGKYEGYDKQVSKADFYTGMVGTPEGLLWSHMSNNRSYQGDRGMTRARRVNELQALKGMRDQIGTSANDYKDVEIKPGDVLYADIPYIGTDNSAYKRAGKFDWKEFSEWAQQLEQPVFVSSVEAPEGFTEIWSKEVNNGSNGKRTERLFVQDKFAGDYEPGGTKFSLSKKTEKIQPKKDVVVFRDKYPHQRLRNFFKGISPKDNMAYASLMISEGDVEEPTIYKINNTFVTHPDSVEILVPRGTFKETEEGYELNMAELRDTVVKAVEIGHDLVENRKLSYFLPQDGEINESTATGRSTEDDILGMAHGIAEKRRAERERMRVDTNPTEAQKAAGNYKHGHVKVDGYDISIENPKGSTRSGKDADGKEWSIEMKHDYGYIRGTEGVDGDHIDVYLSDNPEKGNVYVVDQIDQKTNAFDEHKVMYGFDSQAEAEKAYLEQYEDGWKMGTITEVTKEDFRKWVESSHRKTKAFAEYAMNKDAVDSATNRSGDEVRFAMTGSAEANDEVRGQVINEIKSLLDDAALSTINRSELTRMLNAVRYAKEGNLLRQIKRAKMAIVPMKLKASGRQIGDLLALKTRDKNGKGMAIGKNVTPEVAESLKMVKGRLADVAVTAYDSERAALNQQMRQLHEQNRLLGERMDYAGTSEEEKQRLAAEIEANNATIERLKQDKAEVDAQREQALKDNLEADKATVAAQKQELQDKIERAARGEAKWTTSDNARWAALDILAKRETMADLEGEINELKRQRRDPDKTEREKRACDDLILAAQENLVQQQAELLDMLKDLIDTGRNDLHVRKSAEVEHKMMLLRGAKKSIGGAGAKEISDDDEERENKHWLKQLITMPLYSAEYMMQSVDVNHLGHDGFLYKYFISGQHGILSAENNYLRGTKQSLDTLNKKSREIFGKDLEEVMKEQNETAQDSGVYVWQPKKDANGKKMYDADGNVEEEKVQMPMSKAQATYMHMVWKMADGRAKMEAMGFDEESMQEIDQFIGAKNIEWADYVQREYLKDLRDKYNEKYIQHYGTSMANIENYVPLRTRKSSIREENDFGGSNRGGNNSMAKKVGALIERTHNLNPIDLSTDAFKTIIDHVHEMEEFYAFADVRKDAEVLSNSTWVRNQMNANSAGSFNDFKAAMEIALHVQKPENGNEIDRAVSVATKGLVAGNIAFRNTTALKQMLSVPAFYGYSQDPEFIVELTKQIGKGYGRNVGAVLTNMLTFGFANKSMIKNLDEGTSKILGENIKWCMENLPSFRERVTKGTLGMEALAESFGQGKVGQWLDKYSAQGMSTNKMVDAITCSIGIKAIYNYKYKRLVKEGMEPEKAHRLALMDADIYYNGTQQSNHRSFMSPMQMSRSAMARALSVYQNASIGFARKCATAWQDLSSVKNRQRYINTYAKEYERKGMSEKEAMAKAKATVGNRQRKAGASLAMYGIITNLLWDLGSKGLIGLFASDDDYKDLISWQSLISYPMRGMPATNIAAQLAKGEYQGPQLLWNELGTIAKDSKKYAEDYGLPSKELMTYVISRGIKMTGVSPETWANTALALHDLVANGLLDQNDFDSSDAMTDFMLLLQTPNSNRAAVAKEMYKKMPTADYVEAVLRASKYVADENPLNIPAGLKVLTNKKETEIIDECIKKQMSDEELEAVMKKNKFVEETLKDYKKRKELEGLYDKTTDEDERKEVEKKLKQAISEEKWAETDRTVRIMKRSDMLMGKEDKETKVYDRSKKSIDVGEDQILSETLSELRKTNTAYEGLEGDRAEQFELLYGEELRLYEKLNDKRGEINDLKAEMEDDPSKAKENIEKIRKIRKEAIKLITGE